MIQNDASAALLPVQRFGPPQGSSRRGVPLGTAFASAAAGALVVMLAAGGKEAEDAEKVGAGPAKGGHKVSSSAMQDMPPEELEAMQKLRANAALPKLDLPEDVRTIIEYNNGYGVLSTNSSMDDGFPAGAIVGFATEESGDLVFSFSGMSSHTKDLIKDGRACMTITSREFEGAADGRGSIVGEMKRVKNEEKEAVTAVYQKRHPGAFWVGFGDFTWFRLTNIKSIRYVGGFARAGGVSPEEYAAAKPDPIAAFAGPVCGHLNDDHSDSTRVLVQHFVGVEVDEKPRLVGLDRFGMWAKCRRKGQTVKVRLAFPEPATSRGDVKKFIVEMSKAAASTAMLAVAGNDSGKDEVGTIGFELSFLKALRGGENAKVKPGELLKKYGGAYLLTSTSLALVSFGLCYALVSNGVDVASLLSRFGIEVTGTSETLGITGLAYAIHKALSPVRFPPTVALTPWVAANIFKKEESDLETSDS